MYFLFFYWKFFFVLLFLDFFSSCFLLLVFIFRLFLLFFFSSFQPCVLYCIFPLYFLFVLLYCTFSFLLYFLVCNRFCSPHRATRWTFMRQKWKYKYSKLWASHKSENLWWTVDSHDEVDVDRFVFVLCAFFFFLGGGGCCFDWLIDCLSFDKFGFCFKICLSAFILLILLLCVYLDSSLCVYFVLIVYFCTFIDEAKANFKELPSLEAVFDRKTNNVSVFLRHPLTKESFGHFYPNGWIFYLF